MAIRKHPKLHNHWYLIISQGKGRKQISIPFTGTELEARAAEREIRGQAADGSARIADLLPAYLEWYKTNKLPRSYSELNDTFKRLLPHFGSILANYLLTNHIESYKAKRLQDTWHGKTTSKITINREIKRLMALLRWSANEGKIKPVTIRPLYFPKAQCEQESRPIDILTPAELDKVFSHINDNTRILHELMFWSGIRKNEATHITVRDIDLDRKLIQITGKGGKKRLASIPNHLCPKIKKAIKGKQPNNLLCPNPLTGFPYQDLRTPLETACKKAGITKRVHPHGFRHNHGTALILQGASLPEAQQSLGHADMSTTRKYIHLAAESVTGSTARLEQYMGKAADKMKSKTPKKQAKKQA